MEKLLYQYGSNRRCFGILNDHAVRLSDIRKSNDYDELLIVYPQIFDELLRQYNQNQFPFKFHNNEGFSAIQHLICSTENILDSNLETGNLSNFVTCFSEDPDILSQWRGYADDGKGCCLGFSMSTLQKYCEMSSGVLRLEKVRYVTKKELSTIVQNQATSIINTLRDLREWIVAEMTHDDNDDHTDGLLGFNFYSMIEATLIDSLCYKGIGFAEEREWRLFLGQKAYKEPNWVLGKNLKMMGPRGFSETLAYLRNKIEFNITEDNICPFVPINFSEFEKSPIEEIWLGPKSQISECDLKLYLASKGYENVTIFPSKISYR